MELRRAAIEAERDQAKMVLDHQRLLLELAFKFAEPEGRARLVDQVITSLASESIGTVLALAFEMRLGQAEFSEPRMRSGPTDAA
jgi:hypothetical protein